MNTRPTGIHVLASGRFADVAPDGSVELLTCGWLIEVANGNPEPDSIADCYDIVTCDAPMRSHPVYGDQGWVCDAGHEHLPLEVAWAPCGPEWEREARDRFAETGAVI